MNVSQAFISSIAFVCCLGAHVANAQTLVDQGTEVVTAESCQVFQAHVAGRATALQSAYPNHTFTVSSDCGGANIRDVSPDTPNSTNVFYFAWQSSDGSISGPKCVGLCSDNPPAKVYNPEDGS